MTLHVALFSEQFPPWGSGVARSACRLADQLHRSGHRVTVFTFDRARKPGEAISVRDEGRQPYPVFLVGPYHKNQGIDFSDGDKAIFRRNWIARALEELKKNRPHLIHAYSLLDMGFLAQVCALELELQCLISCRGNDIGKNLFNLNKLAAIRWIVEHATWFTFVNEHLAARARMFIPALVKRSSVVHNGIDLKTLNKGGEALQLPKGKLVGYVGRLGEKKGLDYLTAALAPLSANLVLVGQAGRSTHDRFLSDRLENSPGKERRILLGGRRWSEIPGLLRQLDVFVQPSVDDGHPNALLEAMGVGCPVIATEMFRDVLAHEKEALLVPAGDVRALRSAIEALLDDPARASRLGRAARLRVATEFTAVAELNSYLSIYEKLVG